MKKDRTLTVIDGGPTPAESSAGVVSNNKHGALKGIEPAKAPPPQGLILHNQPTQSQLGVSRVAVRYVSPEDGVARRLGFIVGYTLVGADNTDYIKAVVNLSECSAATLASSRTHEDIFNTVVSGLWHRLDFVRNSIALWLAVGLNGSVTVHDALKRLRATIEASPPSDAQRLSLSKLRAIMYEGAP